MSVTWQVGDRVYVVGSPTVTGTVVTVSNNCARSYGGDNVKVALDGGLATWYADADLECWTRPIGDEDETERARR